MNLDQLRELSKAATPGPWALAQSLGDCEEFALIRPLSTGGAHELGIIGGYFDGPDPVDGRRDADLVVAMRNHWLALLDVAEAARELAQSADQRDWTPALGDALTRLEAQP